MTKKSNAAKKTKSTPANANATTPAGTVGEKKGAQGKLAGTGRLDADDEIEAQAEKVRKITEQWQSTGEAMVAERATLTELLKKKRAGKPYVYEDEDGEMREAFVPKSEKEPQAKVRKLKKILPDAD